MKLIAVDASGKEVLSAVVPDDQTDRIDAEAARRGISREEMILLVIDCGIEAAEQSLRRDGEGSS